jgi:organic radical activating enzyme
MNKLELYHVAFETTRRCNLRCAHCMRGEAQNINMTKDMIDAFFDTHSKGYILKAIHHICFSGGEPTLNYGLIIYTINKIIEENMPVYGISMTTNGQLFIPELVETFNKFNQYRNLKVLNEIRKDWADNPDWLEEMIESNTDNHARITFSTDRFHAPVPEYIRKMYNTYAKGLNITDYAVKDENIMQIGLSTFGKAFENGKCLYHEECVDHKTIFENVYMTAKGDIIFGGDGSYEYMDDNVIGRVEEVSIFDSIDVHGRKAFQKVAK